MLYAAFGISKLGFEKIGISLDVRAYLNPLQELLVSAFGNAGSSRIEIVGNFHIKVESNFVHRLVLLENRAVVIVFVDKTEPIHFERYTGFLEHLAHDGLLGCFAELNSAADRIVIIYSGIAAHKQFAVFYDYGANPDIEHAVTASNAHIFIHKRLYPNATRNLLSRNVRLPFRAAIGAVIGTVTAKRTYYIVELNRFQKIVERRVFAAV